uniref:Uncharacterized protein n=1 Tax=Palpitomonas bilix TaxID=652834 RepID=A0A7S3DGI8_9EUKA
MSAREEQPSTSLLSPSLSIHLTPVWTYRVTPVTPITYICTKAEASRGACNRIPLTMYVHSECVTDRCCNTHVLRACHAPTLHPHHTYTPHHTHLFPPLLACRQRGVRDGQSR